MFQPDEEWREERIAKNEASFRLINERLRNGLRRLPQTSELVPFVCECGSRRCADTVELTSEEYEAVRAQGNRFVVLPGHVFPEYETLVAEHDRYAIVEKLGVAKLISELSDPRDDDAVDPTVLA